MNRGVVAFVVLAGVAGALARNVAADEHVTAPSLPSQPNKETVAQPGGALKTTRDGLVYQGPERRLVTIERPPREAAPANDPALPKFAEPPKAASGPLGAPVVAAAFVTRRGTVAKFDKGTSITILEKNGKERTVPLAKNASVYADLKVGDDVAVRVPFDESSDGKTADRVEKHVEKAKSAALEAPRSKFSQAQVKGN